MNTYDYNLVTDRYKAAGQVDAESEEAAKAILKDQVANPRKMPMADFVPPKIKSLKLTLTKSA